MAYLKVGDFKAVDEVPVLDDNGYSIHPEKGKVLKINGTIDLFKTFVIQHCGKKITCIWHGLHQGMYERKPDMYLD